MSFDTYYVAVFIRVEGKEETEQSSSFHKISPSGNSFEIIVVVSFIPTVPWNITLERLSSTEVRVEWIAPYHDDTTYRISLSPSSPPYSVEENNTNHIVRYPFIDGTNYTFTVAAKETYNSCDGNSTNAYLVFDGSAVDANPKILFTPEIGSTWVYLTWNPVEKVSGFTISTYEPRLAYVGYPDINTTETSYNVTGLTSGTVYEFVITPYGPHSVGKQVIYRQKTDGEQPPMVNNVSLNLKSGVQTAVELSWSPPKETTVEWEEYGVIYKKVNVFINFI